MISFTMNLSSGDPQPIISNVALGPSALGQHWKLLASAHHLIKPHCFSHRADEKTSNMDPEQLDFDPEEDDETMLRLKALETQVY